MRRFTFDRHDDDPILIFFSVYFKQNKFLVLSSNVLKLFNFPALSSLEFVVHSQQLVLLFHGRHDDIINNLKFHFALMKNENDNQF